MPQLQAAGIEAIEFGRDEYGQSIRQVKAGIEFAQQARERLRRRRRGIADSEIPARASATRRRCRPVPVLQR
ncbi:MAG: hypothetical protein R3F08_04150 [Dokdonella sp.]